LERMQRLQLAGYFQGYTRGTHGVELALAAQDLGHGLAFDILHGDEKAALQIAEIVYFDHTRVECVELLLNGCAAAFGVGHQPWGGRMADQLQHGAAILCGVEAEVNIGHTVSEFALDIVRPEAQAGRRGGYHFHNLPRAAPSISPMTRPSTSQVYRPPESG